MQIGFTSAFSLPLSDFKTKTSFGFLIKKLHGACVFDFFEKSQNELVWPFFGVFGGFGSRINCCPIILSFGNFAYVLHA